MCRQLATAYDAGIPITRALQLAGEHTKNRQVRETMVEMSVAIQNGSTLGEAARAQRKQLPPMLVDMLDTGEHGGRLDAMLREVADYYEDRLALRRRVMSMMTLPVVYIVAAWFLGSFSLGLISQLNLDARNPFNLGTYFESYLQFQASALILFATVAAVLFVLNRLGVVSGVLSQIARVLWPFNAVSRKFALARFFRSFALLTVSGLNVKHCIARAAAVTGNPHIQRDLLQAVPRVADGQTLTQAFAPCRTLDPTAREMITVGEESGELDAMLRKLAQYQQDEASHTLDRTIRIIGVLIMLAVGLLVGYIVISFWSRYFSLLGSI